MNNKPVPGKTGVPPNSAYRANRRVELIVVMSLLVLMGISWYFLFFHSADDTTSAAVRDTSEIYLREIASQKENQLQTNLHNQMRQLSITAEILGDAYLTDEASMRDFLGRMRQANEFSFLGLLDQDGIVHTQEQRFPGISKFNFLAKDLTQEVVEFNNTVSSSNLVMFVVPVSGHSYNGVDLLALVCGVDTKAIADRMAFFDADTSTFCEVVMKNGTYVIQAPTDHLGSGSNFLSAMDRRAVYDKGYSHEALIESMETGEQLFTSYTVDGARYFTCLMPVDGTDWYVKASISYDAVGNGVEVVRKTLTRNSMIHMLLLLLMFAGAFSVYLIMRRRQETVIMARIQAEESNRAKTDFLSQMSHDIRTPMNAIVGFTDFAMREPDIHVIQDDYLPKIRSSGQHLLMLINDVLEMSRIESGKLELNEEPVHLESILQEITSIISLRASNEGLNLHTQYALQAPWVYCDKLRINQVLMNLLGNAVKFTPKGGNVTLNVFQTYSQRPGFATYQFQIRDTGIGMSREFLDKVFDPFERERTSTVSGKEGTGLGLTIVKRIVDAIGGTITVDSVQGEGSTFTVSVELRLMEEEVIQELENRQRSDQCAIDSVETMRQFVSGKRVLLVEDNDFNRLIAQVVLEEAGLTVDQAEDGRVAVEMVSKAPAGFYAVVLMDIQMPFMNGYDATRAIRCLGDDRAKVPILAVTANAFASDVKEAKDAGMDGHIPKPIDVSALYKVLAEIL